MCKITGSFPASRLVMVQPEPTAGFSPDEFDLNPSFLEPYDARVLLIPESAVDSLS